MQEGGDCEDHPDHDGDVGQVDDEPAQVEVVDRAATQEAVEQITQCPASPEAVAEDRDRSGTSEGYAAHFARIYQAIRAAIEADRQPSEPAPDPRLDAGT